MGTLRTACVAMVGLALFGAFAAPGDELRRRGIIGAHLGPLTAELRERHGLPADAEGAFVMGVTPNGAAAAAGVKAGDLIQAIGDVATPNQSTFSAAMRAYYAGDAVPLKIRRGDQALTIDVKLVPMPRETSESFDIVYGHVVSGGNKLRTIITRPRAAPTTSPADAPTPEPRRPGLLFIQGLSCGPVDGVPLYQNFLYELTRRGVITMRVEKPGAGDSEGGPCSEINFQQELDGYRQALRALKQLDDVDPARVFIFGHSMGGIMGPLLAAEEPVRGVAVYGTGFKTWLEYCLENTRRQAVLGGMDYEQVEALLRNETLFDAEFLVARKSPREIREQHPDLRAYLDELVQADTYMFGRHYTFFQQLQDVKLAEAWGRVGCDVLAIWGTSDFVTCEEDHEAIADAANRRAPGAGRYVRLPGTDHGFARNASPEESLRAGMQGEYSIAVTDTLVAWVLEVAGRPARAAVQEK